MHQGYKNKIILILFFLSGLAGLAYQVVWIKMSAQIFGHTIYAVSSVVATFMAGLAAGSYYWGRRADRIQQQLRLYAGLEAGIGLYALVLVFSFPLLNQFYTTLFHFLNLDYSSLSITRFIFSFLILLLPAFLMGGTFPVLSKFYVHQESEIGKNTGILYGVNTAGAVIGSGLAGFLLIEKLGIQTTTLCMVVTNLLIALIVFMLSRNQKNIPVAGEKIRIQKRNQFILILYALSGFVALALEVLWTRELTIVFLSSTYSFTVVVITFLVGLTLGSLWISRIGPSYSSGASLIYRLEYGIALSTLVSIPLLRYLPQKLYIQAVTAQTISWSNEIFFNFIISFAVIILPTFLMGAVFPVVCALYTRSSGQVGASVGKVYAYNTVGSIAGTLTAGFILIPLWGVHHSIILMSALSFIIAAIVLINFHQQHIWKIWHSLFAAAYLFLFLLFIMKGDGFRPLPPDATVLFSREDASAEVKVLKSKPGTVALYINEKQQGGTQVKQSERRAGQIPLIFHSRPDTLLIIGLGSGVTLNAVSEDAGKAITCVDLIGSLRQAVYYFRDINGDVLNRTDQVKFIVADGINYLNLVEQNYDLILCDIVHPDDVGAGGLFALEFYQKCRARLKAGGFLAQWLLLDQLSVTDLHTILYTFLKVFPDMQIYLGHENTQFQKLLLIGPQDKLSYTPALIAHRLQSSSYGDERKAETDVFSFLTYFVSDGAALRNKLNPVRLNTFDHPLIEYSSPRSKWIKDKTVQNLQYLASLRRPVFSVAAIDSQYVPILKKYYDIRTYILEGRLQELTRQYEKADYYYSQAALADADTFLVSELLTRLAFRLEEQNKKEEGENALRNALAVNNRNGVAVFALAEMLMKTNRMAESIPFYKYAIDIDPSNYTAYRRLGDLYSQKQEFENAFYAYSMSVNIEPVQPVVYYILGQLYLNYKKDVVKAVESFQKSLELDPAHHYHEQARQMLKRIRGNG